MVPMSTDNSVIQPDDQQVNRNPQLQAWMLRNVVKEK
jgi:hypothetical protein